MLLIVNGKEHRTDKRTLSELLDEFKIQKELVAVQKNDAIIRRAKLSEEKIIEGDRIEIIGIVGGGKK